MILALFLSQSGIPDARIGLFMTLTLLGDVVLSFFLTFFADAIGRRRVLQFGALFMTLGGIVFVFSTNYWILVAASIFGVVSPSAGKMGPFLAIEESALSQLTPAEGRNDIFAWINLLGTFGIALGEVGCGWLVHALQNSHNVKIGQNTYRVVFVLYACLGLLKLFLLFLLTDECELNSSQEPLYTEIDDPHHNDSPPEPVHDLSPLIQSSGVDRKRLKVTTTRASIHLPQFTRESIVVSCKLGLLFGVDAFASGLVASSWLAYYFTTTFSLAAGLLGTLFFSASLIAACSSLLAVPLAKRFGLVKAGVFSHLPSSIILALIPVSGSLPVAMALLLLRSCTSTMDRAPKQAFLAAAILSHETTAIMGAVNVAKSLTQAAGVPVTGLLAGQDRFWIVFVLAGAMKASCDVVMLFMFGDFESREP
ncbi:hypothetical protein MBLNU459_g1934t1 [Dothideomycetes sp. NU459]